MFGDRTVGHANGNANEHENGNGKSGRIPAMDLERDHLFGQIAVSTGMVREEHVLRCLEIQKASPGRRLGAILVDEGYLDLEQIRYLVATQAERLLLGEEEVPAELDDVLFGQIMVAKGFASRKQVDEAIEEQAKIAKLKIRFRLGEILIQKGYASSRDVKQALEVQKKKILVCPTCGVRYNIAGLEEGVYLRCSRCDVRLIITVDDPSVVVKETVRLDPADFRPPRESQSGSSGPSASDPESEP